MDTCMSSLNIGSINFLVFQSLEGELEKLVDNMIFLGILRDGINDFETFAQP